jgi:hypothetical protein
LAQQRVRTREHLDEGELVVHALSTTLSNYLHRLSEVPIDYPAVAFASDDAART